ncbi:alkaline phosphatase family protein [Paenibacillus campi]|uniref:alkaline phosphatase family protein n=1 Tax=Paenibacillus campi TaxID=3106031 RepID=UPI002AFDE172|nr:alkaline phosphatase family protein [Paenibacillus sp. SGZ-1014]
MMNNKVVVIGLDSINPLTQTFIAEGNMPNLQKLMNNGFHSEMIATMPPTTPVAWTTIATGAHPSSHGVEGFSMHQPGGYLDQKVHTTNSTGIKAETIWQAAERNNKKSILLKYPMSWPPLGGEQVIQVDGAGGWGGLKCVWDLAHSACWDSAVQQSTAQGDHGDWMTRDADNLNEESKLPLPLTKVVHDDKHSAEHFILWESVIHLQLKKAMQAIPIYIALLSNNTVAFSLHKADEYDAQVGLHGWSEWIHLQVDTSDKGRRNGSVRFKVMELDVQSGRLRLYQSQIHDNAGYSAPAYIADELYAAAGPFVEWTESYDLLQGWIDDATQLEIYQQHVDWMIKATRHLLHNHSYDLFMTQLHFLDMAYHIYWGAIDPAHPQYDTEQAAHYKQVLAAAHTIADQYVGEVLAMLDEHTTVFILGDHGQDVYHTNFLANNYLLKHNLLHIKKDPKNGQIKIDWNKTKVYANGYRIYINLKGRQPDGIVEPTEYDELVNRLITDFKKLYDVDRGLSPISIVMNRKEAETFGLYGDTMGDIIIAMASGYQTRSTIDIPTNGWINGKVRLNKVAMYKQTELFAEFTGEHDTSFPLNKNIRTLFFAHGKGIHPMERIIPLNMVNVAPTIAELLNIKPPANCEGHSFLGELKSNSKLGVEHVEFYI